MITIVKFGEMDFSDEKPKEAYLQACKWVANNIMNGKVEVKDISWKINRVEDQYDLPTFRLELYTALNESDFVSDFCKRCKEFHKSFYINQEYNCDSCKMQGYRKQIKQRTEIKRQFAKEKLDYANNEKW